MKETTPDIYVACSLTQAPEEFKVAVTGLKQVLRDEKGYSIREFVGLVDGTEQDVYRWDIHECVAGCEMLLAVCDYPAIGLGYEMGVAVEHFKKPTLAVAHEEARISRLPLGIDQPHYKFRRYKDLMDVPGFVDEILEENGLI